MWLLAPFRPAGPYPPLVLNGPAGSGNSTAVCVLRALVDANELPLRAIPRSASALADLAWRNHVLAFDDVLRIPPAAESNLAIYT
jgi:hypothetical protein